MKSLIMYAVLAATGLASVAGTKAVLTSSPSSQKAVQLKSASVTGNLVDNRLNSIPDPIVLNKNLIRVKVNKDRVIYMNEVVTFESSQRVANEIKALEAKSSEPIYLLLDSPGGSVLDGTAVISAMEASSVPVYTVCTRLCASMAAMIHSYGTKRYSTDRAILMYHPASAAAEGQVPNMLSQLTTLNRYTDKMVANITTRSKLTKDDYNKLVAYELWVDSEDSLQKGLIDGIVSLDVPSYKDSNESVNISSSKKIPIKHNIPTMVFKLMAPESELFYWDHNAIN